MHVLASGIWTYASGERKPFGWSCSQMSQKISSPLSPFRPSKTRVYLPCVTAVDLSYGRVLTVLRTIGWTRQESRRVGREKLHASGRDVCFQWPFRSGRGERDRQY